MANNDFPFETAAEVVKMLLEEMFPSATFDGEALGFLFRSRGFKFTVDILDEMANVFYKFKTGESDSDK